MGNFGHKLKNLYTKLSTDLCTTTTTKYSIKKGKTEMKNTTYSKIVKLSTETTTRF